MATRTPKTTHRQSAKPSEAQTTETRVERAEERVKRSEQGAALLRIAYESFGPEDQDLLANVATAMLMARRAGHSPSAILKTVNDRIRENPEVIHVGAVMATNLSIALSGESEDGARTMHSIMETLGVTLVPDKAPDPSARAAKPKSNVVPLRPVPKKKSSPRKR